MDSKNRVIYRNKMYWTREREGREEETVGVQEGRGVGTIYTSRIKEQVYESNTRV